MMKRKTTPRIGERNGVPAASQRVVLTSDSDSVDSDDALEKRKPIRKIPPRRIVIDDSSSASAGSDDEPSRQGTSSSCPYLLRRRKKRTLENEDDDEEASSSTGHGRRKSKRRNHNENDTDDDDDEVGIISSAPSTSRGHKKKSRRNRSNRQSGHSSSARQRRRRTRNRSPTVSSFIVISSDSDSSDSDYEPVRKRRGRAPPRRYDSSDENSDSSFTNFSSPLRSLIEATTDHPSIFSFRARQAIRRLRQITDDDSFFTIHTLMTRHNEASSDSDNRRSTTHRRSISTIHTGLAVRLPDGNYREPTPLNDFAEHVFSRTDESSPTRASTNIFRIEEISNSCGSDDADEGSDNAGKISSPSKQYTSGDDETADSCPICLIKFVAQLVGTPSICEHNFCAHCIKSWAASSNTCPVDRLRFRYITVRNGIGGKVIRKIHIQKETNFMPDGGSGDMACTICQSLEPVDSLFLCDMCSQPYHTRCLTPPLSEIPDEIWTCPNCSVTQDVMRSYSDDDDDDDDDSQVTNSEEGDTFLGMDPDPIDEYGCVII